MSLIDRVRPRRPDATRGRLGRRGQALVELALVVPVLFLLFAATLDLGRMFYSSITVSNAAREGAFEAAQRPTSFVAGSPCSKTTNRIMCRVINEAKGSFVSVSTADVSVACSPSCATGMGNTVSVQVTGHFSLLTPLLAGFFGGSDITISSISTAQIVTAPSIAAAPTPTPSPTPTPAPTPTPSPTPTPLPTGAPTPTPTPSPTPSPTPTCQAPVASFTVSPNAGQRKKSNQDGTTFFFTDSSAGMGGFCNPTWSWSFGDGSGASTVQNPTYVYSTVDTNPGFTVTLSVSNDMGADTTTRTVKVSN